MFPITCSRLAIFASGSHCRRISYFFALSLLILHCSAENGKQLSYTDILHQLTDLDRLTHLHPGYRAGLFSSWDRNSTNVWGANGDAGHYLRVEASGEAVMMDVDGPGVVYRTWSANPMGKIRVYLDGAATPQYEWNFPDLFDGQLPPFIKPLVYRRDNPQSASDCYLPIPFARHIKITADKAHPQYYHFNYLLYPKNLAVSSFRLPLTPGEQSVLEAAAAAWSKPGRDPKPSLPGQTTLSRSLTLAPGQTAVLCDLKTAGEIRAIKVRLQSSQRYAWRKLVLKGVWDESPWPQILTPLGPFFGFDWETADYGSVPSGCLQGQAYQFFPMPFRKSAQLTVQNFLEQPATIEYEIQWVPLEKLPEDSANFYARWRHEPDSLTFDYPFLETGGHGHFVGVSMPIDHPLPGWWGEGDEKVWVDQDDFPPFIGTGSEDYFGDAWGIRYLSGPSFGASSMKGHRTCNYRWHFMDLIPFAQRMRMTIENYGPNGQGPRGQYDYSSTAFWYQAEAAPVFSQLRGARYTGANDPGGKPAPLAYHPDIFRDLDRNQVQTYGLGITFAQQAEVLLQKTIQAGKAQIITDALRPYEFDREQAVDFGKVVAGQKLAELHLTTTSDGVYYPRLFTAPEDGIADLSFEGDSQLLPIAARPKPHILQLEGIFLTKGEHLVRLAAVTAGRAIFDCLQLDPANRFSEAIEAEELRVTQTASGANAPKPSRPLSGVSAGRVLEFQGGQPGQGFTLGLGQRPALPYVLGVRPLEGPQAGIIQGFARGKPIGPAFDLYAAERHLASSILPLGPMPAECKEIEIRVVGKNNRSQGWNADLDYLRWEPAILGPGTAEGIWAQVLATHDCEYRAQDLGPAYSGGHQFWVQPSNLNAWVDIALEIPRPGPRELMVKYTKSWDYAIIQAYLDETPIGPEVDTYAPAVVPAEVTKLGERELIPGRHVLRFRAVGRHADSKGYLMGIDHIIVK